MTNAPDQIKSLLLEMVMGFTWYHKDLFLSFKPDKFVENRYVFLFIAHADDTSKLIGAGGSMIRNLRYITQRMGQAAGITTHVKVGDPVVGKRQYQEPYTPNPAWDENPTIDLLRRVLTFTGNDFTCITPLKVGADCSNLVVVGHGDEELEDSLSVIFHAIGKANGKKLYVMLKEPS